MMGYGEYGWMFGYGWLWMVAFWAIVIGLVVWAATTLLRQPDRRTDLTPLETLKRRYAAGELSLEEFERAKGALA